MSSQLAAQLRILSGVGGTTTTASKDRRTIVASTASLAAIHHQAPGSTASKYRASFLFRADVAAATDSATIHSMGVSGMEQLMRLEPRLKHASSALFHAHSFDRSSHNTQQLQQIQNQLNSCIRLLAPYFMIKPTHKVLEFLIRRYNIHIYNISALLSAFLPYHDSPLFARLVQILQIQLQPPSLGGSTADAEANVNTHKLFGFLEGAQKDGVSSITRHTLVQRCLNDAGFLAWIIQLVALRHMLHLSNTTITFYTSIILELLNTVHHVNNGNNAQQAESIMNVIVMNSIEVLNSHANGGTTAASTPAPTKGASSSSAVVAPVSTPVNRELFYSTLLILTQIGSIHKLHSSILDSIVYLLFKSLPTQAQDSTLLQPVLMTLVALAQSQNIQTIVPKAIEALLSVLSASENGQESNTNAVSNFVRTLVSLGSSYDIQPFTTLLFEQLSIFHSQGSVVAHDLLCECISGAQSGMAVVCSPNQVRIVVSTLFTSYVSAQTESKWSVKEVSLLRTLVLLIQQHYPSELEKIIQEIIQSEEKKMKENEADVEGEKDEAEDGEEKEQHKKKKSRKSSSKSNPLLSLIHILFEGSSQEILDLKSQSSLATAVGESGVPSTGSILTCLNSPLSHIRIQAIEAVDQLCAENSKKSGSASSLNSIASHLRAALLARLRDSESSVLRAVLKVDSLIHLLPRSDLLSALIKILGRLAHTVEAERIQRDSVYKIIEAVFELATRMVESAMQSSESETQSQELYTIVHALSPFLFEFALMRSNISRKIALAVYNLFGVLSKHANEKHHPAHHHHSVGTNNGFDLCAVFANLTKEVKFPEEGSDEEASYNSKLVDTLVSSLVRLLNNQVSHPTSTVLHTVSAEILSVLDRTANTVRSFTAIEGRIGTKVEAVEAPSTAFVTIHVVTLALAQIAAVPTSSAKKTASKHDTAFLELLNPFRMRLERVWFDFTTKQRQESTLSSVPLPSASSFLVPARFTHASFPAFVRSTFGEMIQTLAKLSTQSVTGKESLEETNTLRAFFTFFLAEAESVSIYGVHLALLCKLHLHGGLLQDTVHFLVPILQGANDVTIQVVVRSYHFLHALLSNRSNTRIRTTQQDHQVLYELIATFLLSIASPSRAIRHAAMMTTQALSGSIGDVNSDLHESVNGAVLKQLLSLMLREKDEFLSAAAATKDDNELLVESPTDASLVFVQSFLYKCISIESATSPFKADVRAGLHQFFVQIAIKLADSSVSAALRLLQTVRRLSASNVAEITLPYLITLLENPAQATSTHAEIIVELLQSLDAGVMKVDQERTYDVISKALKVHPSSADEDAMEDVDASSSSSPAVSRHAASIRRAALTRLTPALFGLMTSEQQDQLFDTLLATLKSTDGVAEIVAELTFNSSVFRTRLVLNKKKSTDLSTVQSILELLQLKDPQRTLSEPFALVPTHFALLEQLTALSTAGKEDASPQQHQQHQQQQQAIEYSKQLTMAVLIRFVSSQPDVASEESADAAAAPAKKSKRAASTSASSVSLKDINVDAVVACLGAHNVESTSSAAAASATKNTALHTLNVSLENTRTHALNLLSTIGKRYPELIVGVLIPIFKSLLQQSNDGDQASEKQQKNALTSALDIDSGEMTTAHQVVLDTEPYAFTLLNKLISTVLPSIIQAKLQWNVWELFSVFVDSLGSGKSSVLNKKKSARDSISAPLSATSPANTPARRRLKLFHNLIASLNGGASANDSDNYLHVVLSLLLAKSITEKSSKRSTGVSTLEFAHDLSETFSSEPVYQINACNNLLHLLTQDINETHAALLNAAHQGKQNGSSKLKISGARKPPSKNSTHKLLAEAGGVAHLSAILQSPEQSRAWQRSVVAWISTHLSRLSFAQQIYLYNQRKQAESASAEEKQSESDDDIQSSFLALFEKLFARLRQSTALSKHLTSTSKNVSTVDDSLVLSDHFVLLGTRTNQALLNLNSLLTMKNFIRILHELFRLGQTSADGEERDYHLILQALSLLNSKLITYKDRQKGQQMISSNKRNADMDDDEDMGVESSANANTDPDLLERRNYHRTRKEEQRLLISLLPSLESLLRVESSGDASQADIAAIKQSTLLNLEMLTSSFAGIKQYQADFVKIVPTILSLTLLPKEADESAALLADNAWQHVSTSSLLFLSTLISALQEKSNVLLIEYIPILILNTLRILKEINTAKKPSTKAGEKKKKKSQKNKKNDEDEDMEESDEDDDDEEESAPIQTLDTLSSPLLQLSALSVLQASIVSVPNFLSDSIGEILKVLLYPGYHNSGVAASSSGVASAASSSAGTTSSVDHSSISTIVSQSLNSLIELIPSRILLPHIFNHYKPASAQGYSSLRRLFQILGSIITQFKAENVKTHFKIIFKFFLAAAQQLRKRSATTDDETSKTSDQYGVTLADAEDALISSFMELTLKLNEQSFKGLFLKLLQWVGPIPNTQDSAAASATSSGDNSDGPTTLSEFLSRSLVFFKLIEQFSAKMKGIFTTYFGYILDHCVVFLSTPTMKKAKQSQSAEEDESDEATANAVIRSKQSKASMLSSGIPGGVSAELIDLVLRSLRNCFKFDQHHFLDKYHFQQLTEPMINQLQYAYDTRRITRRRGEDVDDSSRAHANHLFDEFITNTLAPTVVQMAIRMGNYLQWKPLVSALLVQGRSVAPPVRRASVYCFEQIFLAIGDNFLTVLPELLPWMGELLEDPDVGVEKSTQKLKKIIEHISGETIDVSLSG